MRRAPAAPPELPGYRYQGLLGSGGFADVFLYEQKLPRRRVAVKVLLAEQLSRDTRAQFVAEANLMAQLSAHPYIVTIFHADVASDGRPYFVMEYCSGPSLAARLKREPFGVEDALRTGVRLAGAVATAHSAGILHRDIKPANVLTNDYGGPALTDFGISSTLEGELPVHTMTVAPGDFAATGTGQSAIGLSVPWSPPELFDDEPRADTRSDVFALAATVHTLLAGRSPFEIPGRSNGSLDLIGRIERGAITPIGRADVPRSLQEVLRHGMAVRREDRYQSAVEFARALQRVELELGYAATGIEVPNQAPIEPEPGADANDPGDADETRARSVQSISAQPATVTPPRPGVQPVQGAPAAPPGRDADATLARTPQSIAAQPPAVDEHTIVRAPGTPPPTAQSAARPFGQPAVAQPSGDGAGSGRGPAAASAAPAAPERRSRVGLIVGLAAGAVVAAAVGIAIALSGTLSTEASPTPSAGGGEDAIAAVTVPAPSVGPGVPSVDATSVSFAVSHDDPEEGDRYRWQLADGSGSLELAEGPEIVVSPVVAGQSVCIDVQVQRGSKTSEIVRGCTP